jgi:hypothetical protein
VEVLFGRAPGGLFAAVRGQDPRAFSRDTLVRLKPDTTDIDAFVRLKVDATFDIFRDPSA